MATTLALRQALIANGLTFEGSTTTDQTVTLAAGKAAFSNSIVIADDFGEDVLWQTGDGGLDTFTHGFIISDQDVWVQLRNDDTGAVEYVRLFIPANVLAFIPAKVAGNTTDAFDGSALVDNTDYADVDQIEVYRDAAEGIGDATVSLYLFA